MLLNAKTVTLEVDIRLAPIITVGGRSVTLGPRSGIVVSTISGVNGQVMDTVIFDLMEGGASVRLINYLDSVAVGSYVVIASSQNAFLALNQSVRNYFIALGSRAATNLSPGDRWIFVVRVEPLTASLSLAETVSKAPDCPLLNLPELFLVVKLALE